MSSILSWAAVLILGTLLIGLLVWARRTKGPGRRGTRSARFDLFDR